MIIHAPSVSTILGVIIFMLVTNVIAVVLRFYARRGLGQKFRTDDWLMIPVMVGTFGAAACLFHGLRRGSMGKRFQPPMDAAGLKIRSDAYAADAVIVESRMLESSFFCLVIPTLGLIKIAVLFFYRRIFVIQKHLRDSRNLLISGMIVIIIMWTIAYTFAKVFSCGTYWTRPFYDFDFSMTHCVNTIQLGYSYAITDVITDGLIFLIPIPLIWKLQLPLAQRFAVLAVFAVGLLSLAASVVRLSVAVWLQHVTYDPEFDEELNLTAELFWGLIEVTTAVLAACLPTLRALVKVPFVSSTIRSLQSFLSPGSKSQISSPSTPPSPEVHYTSFADANIFKQPKVIVQDSRIGTV